eukprot:Nk52_evm29s152 gene=Nk52_evmTU29s152
MLAFLEDGLRQMLVDKFGPSVLEDIKFMCERCFGEWEVSGAEVKKLWLNKHTFAFVKASSEFLGLGIPSLLEVFGQYWVDYVSRRGFAKVCKAYEEPLEEVLSKLNKLHGDLINNYEGGNVVQYFPNFTCVPDGTGQYKVCYTLKESHLLSVGKGMLRGVCKKFVTDSYVELEAMEESKESATFRVKFVSELVGSSSGASSSTSSSRQPGRHHGTGTGVSDYVRISGKNVHKLFPFHFVINYDFKIIQIGQGLKHLFPDLEIGQSFQECFDFSSRPHFVCEMETLITYLETVVILSYKGVKLQGEFVHFPEGKQFVYFGAPTPEVLRSPEYEVTIQSLPIYARLPVAQYRSIFGLTKTTSGTLSPKRSSDDDGPPADLKESGPKSRPRRKTRAKSASIQNNSPALNALSAVRPRSRTAREDELEGSALSSESSELTLPPKGLSANASSRLPGGRVRRVSLGMASDMSKNPLSRLKNEFHSSMQKRFSVDGTSDTRKQSNTSSNMDITAPMERIFQVLHKLKASVSDAAAMDIDYLIKELSSSDVYTPTIDSELPKTSSDDAEFNDYMEGFLRPEKSIKFNRTKLDITAGKQLALNLKNSDPSQVNELLETIAPPISVFTQNPSQVVKSGFLTKSSCTGAWNRRYFIMDDSCMYYYKNRNPETRPAGVIGLHDYDYCEISDINGQYCFKMKNLTSPDIRVYDCYADTKETTDVWVKAIKEQLKIVKYFSSVEDGADAGEVRASTAFPEFRKRSYSETSSNASLKNKAGLSGVGLEDLYEEDLSDDDSDEHEHIPEIHVPQGPNLRRLDSIVARNAEEQIRSIKRRSDNSKSKGKKIRRRLRRPFEELESLSFNIFTVADICESKPLVAVTMECLRRFNVSQKFKVSEEKLISFLTKIEDGYLAENSYHNAIHAADVTQTLYYFLSTLQLNKYVSDLDIFSAIIAAAIHDFGHPGTNNAFQINTRSSLALMYNDQAVLENMHLAKSFEILSEADSDIFSNLSAEEFKHCRGVIVQMVLGTDMSLHFELLGKFKSAVASLKELDPDRVAKRDSGNNQDIAVLPHSTILLLLSLALHCADVSNPVKQKPVYLQWADNVMEEFFAQGDREKQLGLSVSPFMDRTVPESKAKCQTSFIKFIVEPLYSAFAEFLTGIGDECMSNLAANYQVFDEQITKTPKNSF